MDHVVYLDTKADELNSLLEEKKRTIVRGAAGRKMPYGRVNIGDVLYFINNDGSGKVVARGTVASVFNSEKMDKDESAYILEQNQDELHLTEDQIKRWAGKRYLVLVGVENVEKINEFEIDKSEFGNMDDWLMVEEIERVKK